MKNIIIILMMIFVSSCYVLRNEDISNYTTHGAYIYHNNVKVAKLKALEYSYDDGKVVKEITVQFVDIEHTGHAKALIAYLHSKVGRQYEIEIDIPIDAESILDYVEE